jgi:predicted site-specific integrase-resolvase
MNLVERAQAQHIRARIAYRWFRAGTLPVLARGVRGRIMLGDLSGGRACSSGRTVACARISSADQKADLDRWVERVTA